jgi:hypothetical protein
LTFYGGWCAFSWFPALVVTLYLALAGIEVSKECRGGDFSSGFSRGFDVARCDLVVRRFGRDTGVHVPLPR